jgi:hypothetical protein
MSLSQLDPPLDAIELMLYRLIEAVNDAQLHHRFHDPAAPTFTVDDFEKYGGVMKAMKEVRGARADYYKTGPLPQPREALALAPLWDYLIANPRWLEYHYVGAVEPIRRESEDLYFDGFAISQRRVDERRSPHGWLARSYFVGIPSGDKSFRCMVKEASGRWFCTVDRHNHCEVPASDDFGVVRVSGMRVNDKTRERKPGVMHLYLPTKYGEWQRIVGAHGKGDDEKILGYGEA